MHGNGKTICPTSSICTGILRYKTNYKEIFEYSKYLFCFYALSITIYYKVLLILIYPPLFISCKYTPPVSKCATNRLF